MRPACVLILCLLLSAEVMWLASAGRGRGRDRGRDRDRDRGERVRIRKKPKGRDCGRIKENVCTGVGLPYNRTALPNVFGHSNQKLVRQEVQNYRSLIESGCSPYIRVFLCVSLFPECPRRKRDDPRPPCRSLCEKARRDCESTLNDHGFAWPAELACENLPEPRREEKRSRCINYEPPRPEYCSLHKDVGPCRTYYPYWYFDTGAQTCQPFTYGGCFGNQNRFSSKEECLRTCGMGLEETDELTTTADKQMDTTTVAGTTTTITVSQVPVIDGFPQDSMIAEGQGVTLKCHAEGALEYTWSRVDGAMPEQKIVSEMVVNSEAILVLHNLTSQDSGFYQCMAENDAGVAEASAKITVMARPQITQMPLNMTLNRGDPFELICQATGSPQPRVTWERKDGKRVLMRRSESTALLSQESASTSDAGIYYCKATNSLGSTTQMVHVRVLVPPRWNEKPISKTVTEGDDVTLRCDARGTEPLNVTWRIENGENISMPFDIYPRFSIDSNTNSFRIAGVQPADKEFVYHCEIANEAGAIAASAKLQVIEHWQLPTIAAPLPNKTAFVGDDVRMSCQASGDPAPQVAWFLQDLSIDTLRDARFTVSESGEELQVRNLNLRDSGTYSCVAANVNGIKRVKGELRVVEPSLKLTNGLTNTTVENGSALNLFCAASGEPKPEVTWFFNDKPINVTVSPSYIIEGGALTVREMTSQHEGKYGCLLNNEFFVVSSIAMVNISRRPATPTTDNEVSIPMLNKTSSVDPPKTPGMENASCQPCPKLQAIPCDGDQRPAIKPRRYDITDAGLKGYFRGWVDVTGQGAANDYCRIIMTPTRGLDTSLQLACALAGTENHSEYNYMSGERFDAGHMDTWYMRDEDGDGRDDYCRCTSDAPDGQYVYCTKADIGGFHGAPGVGESQYSFRVPNGDRRLLRKCRKRKVDPFFGVASLSDN
ncbi:basement membrane-specific heparan sulfate proteoglycan core protein-like isoform X3 [Acanthaster planci]|uniref:Basement membrane-specific heparan sulfate proteoglycan core protein-like isoform X3 n=1 Tax=Acanthaster planci TaxID=133434 RepID=A0A8B7XTW4_ACAPL|nr:basement membrane-specific heparan sulfate proteoglycan core protein-like isoform X3 [Acanthaster planci]